MSTFSQFVGSRLQSQTFNSSGTFTVPTGVNNVWLSMSGGGGSSGYTPNCGGASGGGAGAWCAKLAVNVTPGTNHTVTIGAGGSYGNGGGTTSFGNLASRVGGSPGQRADYEFGSGGSGGALGGGVVQNNGYSNNGANSYSNSYRGMGGSAGGSGGAAGGTGGGGFFGNGANSGTGGSGGNACYPGDGFSGKCIVEWLA